MISYEEFCVASCFESNLRTPTQHRTVKIWEPFSKIGDKPTLQNPSSYVFPKELSELGVKWPSLPRTTETFFATIVRSNLVTN